MKIIAITSSIINKENKINTAYIKAFTSKETLPIIIPIIVDEIIDYIDDKKEEIYEKRAQVIAEIFDALILTGGSDINPINYEDNNISSTMCNSKRDKSDYYLAKAFIKAKKPIMGICRGMQYLGLIYKLPNFKQSLSNIDELHNGNENELTSRQEYAHKIEARGNLTGLVVRSNSFHHQGFVFKERVIEGSKNKTINKEKDIKEIETETELNILANTERVIEAFEHKTLPIFAVQWHPEEYGNKSIIIKYFINKYLK